VIDELADRAGVGEQVRAITESAMNGEIDFSESFKQRMALLEGLRRRAENGCRKSTHHARGASSYEGPEILRIQDRYFVGGFTYLGSIYKKNWDYVSR
jgi:phosphoserine phosphatase